MTSWKFHWINYHILLHKKMNLRDCICLCLLPDRTWLKVMTQGRFIGRLRREKSGTSLDLNFLNTKLIFYLKLKFTEMQTHNTNCDINIKTLNWIGQLAKLTASAIDHKINIICIQEHRYTHSKDIIYHDTGNGWTLDTASAWKNATIDVGSSKITK